MASNMIFVFGVSIAIGTVLIATGGREQKEPGAKDWPLSVQWGYIALVVGCFGLLSDYMSFTAVMLVFVAITGVVWAVDKWALTKKRAASGEPSGHFIEYSRSFFPVIFVVFVLRSFLVEPFQIPSSSMRPGLIVGDFILVNKFTYGIRFPVLNNTLIPVGKVQRGDVVVFSYPLNPKINYIKRAIGLPGDIVEYRNKNLIVNGTPVQDLPDGHYEFLDVDLGRALIMTNRSNERLGTAEYKVITDSRLPTLSLGQVQNFPYRDNCRYDEAGFICKVPAGQYFMLGDNRDYSGDGRYWGFVEDRLIVGKAFMIWMNFGHLSRIGFTIR